MLSVAGADHIITMDLHASQIQVSVSMLNDQRVALSSDPYADVLNIQTLFKLALKIPLGPSGHRCTAEPQCYL